MDSWAVGVITYQLVYGRLPFHSEFLAEVIEQRAAASFFLVPPGLGLLAGGLRGVYLDFVRDVAQWAAIAVIVVNLLHHTDQSFVAKSLGRDVGWIPPQRPVDRSVWPRLDDLHP